MKFEGRFISKSMSFVFKLLETFSSISCNSSFSGNRAVGNANGNPYNFGGELTKVNIFAKELNEIEVKQMWEAGIGSKIEGNSFYKRSISWEVILRKERLGSIVNLKQTLETETSNSAGKFT